MTWREVFVNVVPNQVHRSLLCITYISPGDKTQWWHVAFLNSGNFSKSGSSTLICDWSVFPLEPWMLGYMCSVSRPNSRSCFVPLIITRKLSSGSVWQYSERRIFSQNHKQYFSVGKSFYFVALPKWGIKWMRASSTHHNVPFLLSTCKDHSGFYQHTQVEEHHPEKHAISGIAETDNDWEYTEDKDTIDKDNRSLLHHEDKDMYNFETYAS